MPAGRTYGRSKRARQERVCREKSTDAQNNLALNKSLKIEEDLKRQLKEKDNRIAALQNELAIVQQKLNALNQKRKATA